MSKHDSTFLDIHSQHPRPCPAVPNPKFTVLGHSIINAPPAAVRDALLDLSNYRNWNPFVPSATIRKPAAGQTDTARMQAGTHFEFRVKMSESTTTSSKELCTFAEPVRTATEDEPYPTTTARWQFDAGGVPLLGYLLQAEHVNELTDLGDGRTEYVHWESFGGVLAHLIKWFSGDDLGKHFREWADNLKLYVEKTSGSVES